MQSLDITLVYWILSLNRAIFDGRHTSDWQCYDDRFFDLVKHIRDLRNDNSHLGISDLPDSKREYCIRCIYEISGYFTDDFSGFPPIYSKDKNQSKTCSQTSSSNKTNEVQGVVQKSGEIGNSNTCETTSEDGLNVVNADNVPGLQNEIPSLYDNGPKTTSNQSIKDLDVCHSLSSVFTPESQHNGGIKSDQILEWKFGSDNRYAVYHKEKRISCHAVKNLDGTLSPLESIDGFTGVGLVSYKDGSYYEGPIVDGSCTGFGPRYARNGKVLRGLFVKSEYVGHVFIDGREVDELTTGAYNNVKIQHLNGSYYEGCLKRLKPNGVGRIVDSNGHSFRGVFLDGKLRA